MIKIEYDETKQIVIAKKNGTADMSEIIKLINSTVTVSEQHNCYKLLFDMQAADETMSFLDGYLLHKNLTENTNLNHHHQCAVIYSPDVNKGDKEFYETVGLNWGQAIFKIFFDMNEGEKWLKTHNPRS